ncbi:hypothetical protein ACFXEL_37410 [Streptomyces sp. NPDC059382]|uniref:hypothetical protein n=1 Tax=Streptomyces sp. NPDC059382 TaxID=3346816 RepID=UPI0036B5D570
MTTTETRAPEFYACTCDAKSRPHLAPVQRILVVGGPEVAPARVHEALWDIRYDLSLFYGPDVVMVITYQEEETGTVAAARDWAAANGVADERRGDEAVSASLLFLDPADRPGWSERRPAAGPAFVYDAA